MNTIIIIKTIPLFNANACIEHGCYNMLIGRFLLWEGEVMEYDVTYEKYIELTRIRYTERTYNDIIS